MTNNESFKKYLINILNNCTSFNYFKTRDGLNQFAVFEKNGVIIDISITIKKKT